MLNWQSKQAGDMRERGVELLDRHVVLVGAAGGDALFEDLLQLRGLGGVVGGRRRHQHDRHLRRLAERRRACRCWRMPIFGSVAVIAYLPDCGQQLDELALLVGLGRQLAAGAAQRTRS